MPVPAEGEAPDARHGGIPRFYFYSWTRRCRPGTLGQGCYNSEGYPNAQCFGSKSAVPTKTCLPLRSASHRTTGALDEGIFGVDAVMSWQRGEAKTSLPYDPVLFGCRCILSQHCGQGPLFCRTTRGLPLSRPPVNRGNDAGHLWLDAGEELGNASIGDR